MQVYRLFIFGFCIWITNNLFAFWGSDCFPDLIEPGQLEFSYTTGKGLGYKQSYGSVDLFLTQPLFHSQLVPFADLRGHYFNRGKRAANFGLGLRWLNPCWSKILGINGFYDLHQTSHRYYHQVSLGYEILTESLEFRCNYYQAVGCKKTSLYEFHYVDLAPKNFLVIGKEQLAMSGVDAELGYHFYKWSCFNLYTGAGPYYYWGRSSATKNAFRHARRYFLGGRVRLAANFLSYLSLEAITTYDQRFKWTGQVTLSIHIPFDFTFNFGDCLGTLSCGLQERLFQPVLRNEIIIINRIHRHSTNPEILNPEHNP